MTDYNARIELDSRDFDETAVDVLMDVVEPYAGAVARAVHGGRVELILTVPAENLRQATITALSVVLATGHQVYALEVLPTDEFHRRIDSTPMPPLLSVPQAADELGVSRQRVLELAKTGQLEARQVGTTWVVPAAAVATRDGQTGLRWSGLVVPVGTESNPDQRQMIDEDAIDVDRQPLPVYDEGRNLIGLARRVFRDEGGWFADGVLRGVAPGEYGVIPDLDNQHVQDDGPVRHVTRALLRGLTITVHGHRESSFPQASIQVSDARAHMDLTLVGRRPEVYSYP